MTTAGWTVSTPPSTCTSSAAANSPEGPPPIIKRSFCVIRSLPGSQSAREARASGLLAAPVVLERIVALPHGLPEPHRLGAPDEVAALLGVARDAIEERAEQSTRGEAHVLDRLVGEELQHDELGDGQTGHPTRERHRVVLERVVGDHF